VAPWRWRKIDRTRLHKAQTAEKVPGEGHQNSKPFYTLSVPCIKIRGGATAP